MNKHTEEVLAAIAAGELTREQAAIELECSPRHVNRLMIAAGVRRPPGVSRAAPAVAPAPKVVRQALILKWASLVEQQMLTVVSAATKAGCSERTIYRYLRKPPF